MRRSSSAALANRQRRLTVSLKNAQRSAQLAFRAVQFGTKTRINTNGLGNLVNNGDIAPKLAGLIDCVSISLNTPDAAEYNKLVRPKFGGKSYQAMLDFAKECRKYVPDVVLTTVATTLTKKEEEECADICKKLGVRYRIRPWES